VRRDLAQRGVGDATSGEEQGGKRADEEPGNGDAGGTPGKGS